MAAIDVNKGGISNGSDKVAAPLRKKLKSMGAIDMDKVGINSDSD